MKSRMESNEWHNDRPNLDPIMIWKPSFYKHVLGHQQGIRDIKARLIIPSPSWGVKFPGSTPPVWFMFKTMVLNKQCQNGWCSQMMFYSSQ